MPGVAAIYREAKQHRTLREFETLRQEHPAVVVKVHQTGEEGAKASLKQGGSSHEPSIRTICHLRKKVEK